MASCTILSILSKAKADSWNVYVALYDMVLSTSLYALPTWGLRYCELIEATQTDIFKRLLFLPRNTSGAILRLEVELVKVFCRTIRLTWDWFIRILKMGDKSLPKICMMRLINLAESLEAKNRYNWAIQFTFLAKTDSLDL